MFPDNARLYIHTSTNVGECEKKFLVVYKYGMHTLEYEAFRKIPILLLDTEQYQVTHDHFYYWAFATEVYDHLQGKINHIYDYDIQGRLHLMMDLLFMLPQEPDPSAAAQKLRKVAHALSSRLDNVESNSFLILSHLVYPLIEGLGRRMLPSIIAKDGTVLTNIQRFAAQDGEVVDFIAASGKRKINSIGSLLRILEYHTTDLQLQNDLKDFRVHFDAVYSQHTNQQKAYDVISEFRNILLHRETLWQVLYAALTNLACMLITSTISKAMYDGNYNSLMGKLQRNQFISASETYENYYPP